MPVWTVDRAIYHLSLHLADSVPATERAAWQELREELAEKARTAKRPFTAEEIDLMKSVYNERVEKYLAAGYGGCLLKKPEAARALVETIEHDHGAGYLLHCWTIMPNHLHVIAQFDNGTEVRPTVETWKKISAHRINKAMSRNGSVWANGFYSRIIRDAAEYRRQIAYVMANPTSAGLTSGFLQRKYI